MGVDWAPKKELSIYMSSQPVAPGDEVGSWHLEIVRNGWSPTRTLMDPPPGIQMGDQDADHPREYEGDVATSDTSIKLEWDPGSAYLCGPGDAPPQTNPCTFIDYVNLTQIGDQKIHYHARNHGGRCVVQLLIYQRLQVKVTEDLPQQSWVMGATFVVMVPADAVDATVIGKMGPNDVFFTPSSPLSGDDATRFALVDTKQVVGVGTYYSFRVVNPFPNSAAA
jgi:hypothetical protein